MLNLFFTLSMLTIAGFALAMFFCRKKSNKTKWIVRIIFMIIMSIILIFKYFY